MRRRQLEGNRRVRQQSRKDSLRFQSLKIRQQVAHGSHLLIGKHIDTIQDHALITACVQRQNVFLLGLLIKEL